MTRNDSKVFKRTKKILWDFFHRNCLKKLSNPHNIIPRKELTLNEEKLISLAKRRLPDLQQILKIGIEFIKKEKAHLLNPEYIKSHFSECATALESSAFNVYLKNQEDIFHSVIEEWVIQNADFLNSLYKKFPIPQDYSKELCKYFYPIVQKLEFDFSQTRKARGGKTFEHIVEYLLKETGISCERPLGDARRVLKRIDLVVPSQDVALRLPDKAYFLSCKRTLRERWKQTIPERKPSWRVFLLTVDDSLPGNKAREIDALGMIVYVKDELKEQNHLKKSDWVRKLSDLPRDIR